MTHRAATGPFAPARRAWPTRIPTGIASGADAGSAPSAPSALGSSVQLGSRVLYRDQADGEVEQVAIVAQGDADFRRGLVSVESPLGRALLGYGVGECVKARTPGGVRVLSILGVEP